MLAAVNEHLAVAGTARGGPMAGTISLPTVSAPHPDPKRAQKNFARLMARVANLYCTGGSSSVSGLGNLYDLLLPHENELARTASRARQT